MARITDEEVARVAKALRETKSMEDADIETLALAAGVIKPAVYDVLVRYPNDGSESLTDFLTRLKPVTPHWYPPAEPSDGIDAALIEAACGAKPTLAKRAELYKVAGPDVYAKILTQWDCSPTSLAPGRKPGASTDDTAKAAAKIVADADSNSPFNPARKLSDAVRINEIGKYIRAFGTKSAARSAEKFGVDLAGRALRKRA